MLASDTPATTRSVTMPPFRHRHLLDTVARALADAATDDIAVAALRAADALTAAALRSIASRGGLESDAGLPTETVLALDARQIASDARALAHTASVMRAMPCFAAAVCSGRISLSQARAIASAVAHVDASGRDEIDVLVSSNAAVNPSSDPEDLLARVDDAVSRLRADLALTCEDRSIARSFLRLQPSVFGGGSLYGEADAERFASIAEALDARADEPHAGDGERTRPMQLMDALVDMCEETLSGASGGSVRPRPRFLATIDLSDLSHPDIPSARVLHAVAGPLGRLTPVGTATALCDAVVVPIAMAGARPVAVGDARATIPAVSRTALAARDRGCRFPGCRAPVRFCDAHHIVWRARGGGVSVDNLLLLCRRHHRMVHRHGWRISHGDDGAIEFTRRGKRYVSLARAPTCRT